MYIYQVCQTTFKRSLGLALATNAFFWFFHKKIMIYLFMQMLQLLAVKSDMYALLNRVISHILVLGLPVRSTSA